MMGQKQQLIPEFTFIAEALLQVLLSQRCCACTRVIRLFWGMWWVLLIALAVV